MTEPEGDGRAISVAELLARNGQRVGAGGGGRRRRGVKGGISVAELTGEFAPVRLPREGEVDDADASADTTPADTTPADTAPEPAAEAAADTTAEAKADGVDKAGKPDEPTQKSAPEAEKTEADEKAEAVPAAPTAADAPTVVAPAVTAGDAEAPADAAATTVLPTVPRLSPIAQHEPRLLAGRTPGGEIPGEPVAPVADETVTDPAADDVDDFESESEPSNAKQWAILLGQGAVAVVAGALMFKGFERLWDMLPMVALVLAVLVIVGLVAMVRILRRTDDIASLVIAVVAGVFVTLGPLAFLLSTS